MTARRNGTRSRRTPPSPRFGPLGPRRSAACCGTSLCLQVNLTLLLLLLLPPSPPQKFAHHAENFRKVHSNDSIMKEPCFLSVVFVLADLGVVDSDQDNVVVVISCCRSFPTYPPAPPRRPKVVSCPGRRLDVLFLSLTSSS